MIVLLGNVYFGGVVVFVWGFGVGWGGDMCVLEGIFVRFNIN